MARIDEELDAPGDESTSYQMKLGDSFHGTISEIGDVDLIAFNTKGSRGYNLQFELRLDGVANGLENRAFRVLNEFGEQIGAYNSDGSFGNGTIFAKIPVTEPQKVFLEVSGARFGDRNTGDYRITVLREETGNELTRTKMKPFERYDGVWEYFGSNGGDQDWIAVNLRADNEYVFRLVPDGWSTTFGAFRIYDRDGVEVSTGNDNVAIPYVIFNPEESGEYYIRASHNRSFNQEYFIEGYGNISGGTRTTAEIGIGDEKEGYFFPYFRDRDAYKTEFVAGVTYSIAISGENASGRYEIDVLNADGEVMSSLADWESTPLLYTPSVDGIYFIRVEGFDLANDYDWERSDTGSPDYRLTLGVDGETYGTDTGDRLTGTSKGDAIRALRGDDLVAGGGGADALFGDEGADRLLGSRGGDSLEGGSGKDTLVGGSGNDRLDGGKQADTLIGGKNADTFVYTAGSGKDRIADFGKGNDRIELDEDLLGTQTLRRFIDRNAEVKGNNTVIEFDGPDRLILAKWTEPDDLAALIDLV